MNTYEFFQGTPTRILADGDVIDLGNRVVKIMHTPGHSPGHMCFWEEDKRYLFTGDLVYKDTLFAYYPSTDPPQAYLVSLEKIAALPVERVFPAHHSLDIKPEILGRMRNAFRELRPRASCSMEPVYVIMETGLFGYRRSINHGKNFFEHDYFIKESIPSFLVALYIFISPIHHQ